MTKYLAMKVISSADLSAENGPLLVPLSVEFPEGCSGMCLLFDSVEALEVFHGPDVEYISVETSND